jgi:hypothetical protein
MADLLLADIRAAVDHFSTHPAPLTGGMRGGYSHA